MSLKVKVYHDCTKPSMLIGEEMVTKTTGRGWWKKTTTKTVKKYETAEAHYTCPKCKSEYRWSPGHTWFEDDDNKGTWLAQVRNYTWKQVSDNG